MTSKLKDTALKPIGRSMQLPLANLVPNPKNRDSGTPEEIRGLAKSIAEVGLLYPLIVRRLEGEEEKYEIVAGGRRLKALSLLEVESVPCIVISGEVGERSEVLRVVENHQRKQLSALDEAAAVRGLLDMNWDLATVARSLGRSKAWVSRRASLTELSEHWVQRVNDEKQEDQSGSKISLWPPSHLEIIARFPAEVQDRMLDTYWEYWHRDVPTLAELIQITGEYQRLLGTAPWPLEDETLFPEAGACAGCPKRSAHHPELFPEELPEAGKADSNDRCLDPECWEHKAQAFVIRRVEEVRRDHPEIILLDAGENGEGARLSREVAAPLVHSSDVATCRKSDEGAVPALVVAGPGLGRVKYIQNPHPNGNGSLIRTRQTETVPVKSPTVSSLEDRKAAYDKRRRQVVIDAVKERLAVLAESATWLTAIENPGGQALAQRGLAAKTLRLIFLLLGPFGWQREIAREPLSWPTAEEWQALSKLRNHDLGHDKQGSELLDICWALLRLALRISMTRLTPATGVRDNAEHYSEAKTLCKLLGFDFAALRAQAAEKIPYAKAWSAEVSDDWAAATREPTAAK